jgi:hypothetical protein
VRVVALLDRGIEGVAIEMGDGEAVELRVVKRPRAAASRAPPEAGLDLAETVAAHPGHAAWPPVLFLPPQLQQRRQEKQGGQDFRC